MNWRRAIIPVLMILAAALGAGCTGTSPGVTPVPTPATTAPVTTIVTIPATTLGSLEPGPTVTLDPRFTVAIQVTRNPVTLYKDITVSFQGGAGQSRTQRVDVRITHQDGSVETKSIVRAEGETSIPMGASVRFNGSDSDRVEVTVWQNGVPYKILDRVYAQQTRP